MRQGDKSYETSECISRDTLTFYFLKKDVGLVSPSHLVHDLFLILYFIN